ncbi:MAG: cell wall hydrolase [Sphingobium sp.]|nr:cell wall hydrolase [Sphingobium sp.]
MATQFLKAERPTAARRWIAAALVSLAVALLALAALHQARNPVKGFVLPDAKALAAARPDTPIPTVEPLVLDASNPDEARKLNAEIPFSTAPNPAAKPYKFSGDAIGLSRATDCLAAGMLYEAGDDATGERAVGQVVLNRLRHPAFPKTVCGVVFQGEERATGCQFTFTCDGAMARIPSAAAWDRARGLAIRMLSGDVFKPVGMSTHYHTDWVMPYWSDTLDKVAAVDTHLFFRWKGWWGTPPAFSNKGVSGAEPVIQKLALLSPAHRALPELIAPVVASSLIDDSRVPSAVNADWIGQRIGPGKLVAVERGGNGFVMTVDKGGDPSRYADAAARLCAGRAQCRLLAWTDPATTPKSFPVPESAQPSMSFSYIRIKDSGLERILYNCDEFPSTPRIQCMARRAAAAAPAPKLMADEVASKSRLKLSDDVKPSADNNRGPLLAPAADSAARPRLKSDVSPVRPAANNPN